MNLPELTSSKKTARFQVNLYVFVSTSIGNDVRVEQEK